ncbi:MAG: SelB C-terminal domain-containing protein, partial [Candidatus Zixiibacteriota bacterium]
RRRVLVMVGTTEVVGEIRLFDCKEIRPGEKGIDFFNPDEPVYCLVGDHYVMRLPTPMVTLGGGKILDHLARLPRKRETSSFNYLYRRVSNDINDLIVSELHKKVIVQSDSLLNEADFSTPEVRAAAESLAQRKVLARFNNYLFHVESFDVVLKGFTQSIRNYLEDKPHVLGLSFEQLAKLSGYNEQTTQVVLKYLVAVGKITKQGDRFNLAGRGMSLKGKVKEAHDKIISLLKEQPYTPPSLSSLASGGKNHREAIKYIIDSGQGHKCGSEFVFLSNVWAEIVQFIKQHLKQESALTVADLKDRFGITRKFAIPILEETDRVKLTCRKGDVRVKGEKFESEEFDLQRSNLHSS